MTIDSEIAALLYSQGATLVGFADLYEIDTDVRGDFPYGISIAVALNPQIVSEIVEGPNQQYYKEYERVNNLLDVIANNTVRFLEAQGHRAKWFAATNIGIDPDTLSTILPHKTVATRAGLGWIGKCALLITREFGSAIRITSVLTDVSLSPGNAINESQCGDCYACVDICPGKAPSGRDWQVGLHRDYFFNPFACRKTAQEWEMKREGIRDNICGMCIAACPWTQKYIKSVI